MISELRLGRLIRTRYTYQNIDTPIVNEMFLPENRQRVAVRILDSHLFTNIVFGVFIDGEVRPIIRTTDNDKSLFLSFLSHGELPTKSFWVVPNGVESNFGSIEYLLPESVISDGIQSYIAEYLQWPR